MRKLRLCLPSPAMVVATTALFLTLGGVGYALSSSSDKPADKKLIKHMAPRLSVAHARSAESATNASELGGKPAAAFSRVIYIHVLLSGSNAVVDASQSSPGITSANVTRRETSAFCFKGLPFRPKNGSVTIDYGHVLEGGAELGELQISNTGQGRDCHAGEPVEVATSSTSGTFIRAPFYLVLYG